MTPTGYAGITNSTTFYLYYDESASVFIYSNTAPTWSDVLQGWYNGNDRAFFSMYKDSGGTLYQSKSSLGQASKTLSRVLAVGEWDMNASAGIDIIHGLTQSKIRGVDVLIRENSTGSGYVYGFQGKLGANDGGYYFTTSTTINLRRQAAGLFDSTLFDNRDADNRGWITIWYVE